MQQTPIRLPHFTSMLLTEGRQQLNIIYREMGATQLRFGLDRVLNRQKNQWIEAVVRPLNCLKVECVYNLRQSDPNKIACTHRGETSTQCILDIRLTNLASRLRMIYQKTVNNKVDEFYSRFKVVINPYGEMEAIFDNGEKVSEKNYTIPGRATAAQSREQSKEELRATIEKEAFKYVEGKLMLKQMTQNIQEVMKKAIDTLNPQSIVKQLVDQAQSRRTQPSKDTGTFAMNNGFFMTNINSRNGQLAWRQLGQFKQFTGGNWFYDYRVTDKRHRVYCLGGIYRPPIMQSSDKPNFKGDVIAIDVLPPESTQARVKLSAVHRNVEEFKIAYSGMVFFRSREGYKTNKWDGKAYMIGGINKDLRVSQNIVEYDPEKDSYSIVGAMKKRRFNHTCTRYKNVILIAGGVSFDEYCNNFQTNILSPNARPTDFCSNQKVVDTDIEIFYCDRRQTEVIKTQIDAKKSSCLGLRHISLVLPLADGPKLESRDYLVLFGGNNGIFIRKFALAYDIQARRWVQFGDNCLSSGYSIGSDLVMSECSNIIDFEGIQTENSSVYLYLGNNPKEAQMLTLTSKGSDSSFSWIS